MYIDMIRSFCTKSKGYFVNNDNFRQQAFVSLAFRKDLCYDKIRYGNRPQNGGNNLTNTQKGMLAGLIIAAIIIAMVVFVLILNGAERRIPVQYSRKMVGRKLMG